MNFYSLIIIPLFGAAGYILARQIRKLLELRKKNNALQSELDRLEGK